MLRYLRVTNFAILSDVALEFGAGFAVLTGETGAGKSLIVDAVNLLRGGRASADIPRAGSEEATVEAIFEVPADLSGQIAAVLASAGLPDDSHGGEVLVRRVVHRGGRSRTYVNGALTTASRLAELGHMLVDLSGQHQHQGLTDARRHRAILDEFAGLGPLRERMATAYAAWAELCAERDRLVGNGARHDERRDYLRFQLDEISGAGLRSGEADELARERSRLKATDRLQSAALTAEALFYSGENSAIDQVDRALRELTAAVDLDPELAAPVRNGEDARALLEETASLLRAYANRLEAEPERLAAVEDRLAMIRRLERKYGGDLDAVLARAAELAAELEALENCDQRLAELAGELERATADATAAATALTKARKSAARKLTSEVEAALADLSMASAQLRVAIEPRELGVDGADRIELLLASNRGEDAKPLARIASGGELSRIMLALKLVLRRADGVATYVFDEVDAGIGGATAEVVGAQIRALADCRQVLSVTHLPQIAAFADRHYQVSKFEAEGRTETRVTELKGKARRDEIARMLAGSQITDRARAHAGEMLERARPSAARASYSKSRAG
jgi:DNA repair protein RecN (Recombination protein N)